MAGAVHAAGDSCPEPGIGDDLPADHPACLYYTGTWHYRNERMEQAATSWSGLVGRDDLGGEYDELRTNALNNLGYLRFYGLGLEEDKTAAIGLWREAVSLGHDESEFHLCHAYGDANEPTYNAVRARRHCRRADAIYSALPEPDEDDRAVLEIIREYRAIVEAAAE